MPDELVFEGGRRLVIAPPSGDLLDPTCSPAEAIVSAAEDGHPRYTFVIQLEQGDVEAIAAGGGRFFYTTHGLVAPFQFDTVVET